MFPEAGLIIGGVQRRQGSAGTLELNDPATDEVLAVLPKAGLSEVAEAAAVSLQGFAEWSAFSPYERSKILRRAAEDYDQQMLRTQGWDQILAALEAEKRNELLSGLAQILDGAAAD